MARAGCLCSACVLVGALLLGTAAALYEEKDPVLQLTIENFELIMKSKIPVVVEFYTPWSNPCKAMAPAFKLAAERLEGIVTFATVDCNHYLNGPLCSRENIHRFPTVKLIQPGNRPENYDLMDRSANGFGLAAVAMLTNKYITHFKDQEEAEDFLQRPGLKVVLVTEAHFTSTMLMSVSQRFADRMHFAEVVKYNETQTVIEEDYGIKHCPAFVAQTSDGTRMLYEGEMSAPKVIKWLEQLIVAEDKALSSSGSGGDEL